MPDTGERVVLRLASVLEESIVDGPGMRMVIFAQGCPHRCPGCHNPQTHSTAGGSLFSVKQLLTTYTKHPFVRGITLSGGEPFEQAAAMAVLAKAVHHSGGDVVVYTGYHVERLRIKAKDNPGIQALLNETDLLIDGPFVMSLRSLEIPFAGSLNQRFVALTPLGKNLLDDIPIIEGAPAVERIG